MMLLSSSIAAKAPEQLANILVQLSIATRMEDFAKGLVTLPNVVFLILVGEDIQFRRLAWSAQKASGSLIEAAYMFR